MDSQQSSTKINSREATNFTIDTKCENKKMNRNCSAPQSRFGKKKYFQ